MTEAFSDRQPPPMPEPGSGPTTLLNNLLLKPVLDGLLLQQQSVSHGFNLVHSRLTATDGSTTVDPIPPQSNSGNGSAGSWVRAKRRASGTLAAVTAGWSPLRRDSSSSSSSSSSPNAKQQGFTGTLAQQQSPLLSEKAKMLGPGANAAEEELIVPASSSPSSKKMPSGPRPRDVARETEASGPKPLTPVNGFDDQCDNKSQLGSGYNKYYAAAVAPPQAVQKTTGARNDVKQPPRQQQHRRSLGNNKQQIAPPTVSFDQFGQWFLALNRDIAHRNQVQVVTLT